MVFFTCNACGESLKKGQVEKHYLQRCRNCEVLTCVDCHKDFAGDDYKIHTKCITEEEKYSAKGWQPRASANKGEKKQQSWIANLQSLASSESVTLDRDVRTIVDIIVGFENIPRKRAKFFNFVKNIRRGVREDTIDKTWQLFEKALLPKSNVTPEPKDEIQEKAAVNSENVQAKDEGNEASEQVEKVKKSKKKSKKLNEESVRADDEVILDGASNGKHEEASSATDVEERLGVKMFPGTASLEEETNSTKSKKKKKKKKIKVDEKMNTNGTDLNESHSINGNKKKKKRPVEEPAETNLKVKRKKAKKTIASDQ